MAFGDSIVAGHKYTAASFVNFVAEKEGMTVLQKNAVNGATIMDANYSGGRILTQIQNTGNSTPDYVIFDGGTNDAEYLTKHTDVQIGDATSTDEATFAGSFRATIQKLKEKYDGYHFTWPSPDIYNPFSLLNALERKKIDNYWFGSGTPTYLVEMLRKFHVLPSQLGGSMQAMAADFDAPTEKMEGIVPLLYQSGYFTIKDYNKLAELYTLDIPNGEIRIGLMRSLLPSYLAHNTLKGNTTIARMYLAIAGGDMDGALRLLQEFLSTVPYCDNTNYEGHYQQLFYIIFSLFGMYVDVEVRPDISRRPRFVRAVKGGDRW